VHSESESTPLSSFLLQPLPGFPGYPSFPTALQTHVWGPGNPGIDRSYADVEVDDKNHTRKIASSVSPTNCTVNTNRSRYENPVKDPTFKIRLLL
ncbi:MAG: hypothetical protein OIF58_07900, partial [Cohaesibacter sp.]|nr:hypothetical protein [Cohaesibacter sp.]